MSTARELRSLYPSGQLAQLDAVRGEMLRDPTALDTHTRKKVTADGQETNDQGGQGSSSP